MWQVVHQKIAVRAELIKRGVLGILDPLCPLCKLEIETFSHLFFSYTAVWRLWNRNVIVFEKGVFDSVQLFFTTRFRLVAWFLAKFTDNPISMDSLIGDPSLGDLCFVSKSDWKASGIGGILRDSSGTVLESFQEATEIADKIRNLEGILCWIARPTNLEEDVLAKAGIGTLVLLPLFSGIPYGVLEIMKGTIPGMDNFTEISSPARGLPQMVIESINRCDVDIRKELFGSILLSGGTASMQQLKERLEKDLLEESPHAARVKVLASGNATERRFRREYLGISWFIPANVVLQVRVSIVLHFSYCNLDVTDISRSMKNMELHIYKENALKMKKLIGVCIYRHGKLMPSPFTNFCFSILLIKAPFHLF
ncbi:hypothetical protein F3Y22_tig00111542pilonHSYRG00142 [Hibiscus syriacus]|uniref:Reverse transcriptase zinc-binding domain-containing protein n=1 Tax=Hibiscus syriacus TaxID=106335 RepID=A0A6A2YHI9_HIBSY|nr:hypothetical protein F3Y22_tig00111542pilonHSYRG00142 [Hibiscus syriacus]